MATTSADATHVSALIPGGFFLCCDQEYTAFLQAVPTASLSEHLLLAPAALLQEAQTTGSRPA